MGGRNADSAWGLARSRARCSTCSGTVPVSAVPVYCLSAPLGRVGVSVRPTGIPPVLRKRRPLAAGSKLPVVCVAAGVHGDPACHHSGVRSGGLVRQACASQGTTTAYGPPAGPGCLGQPWSWYRWDTKDRLSAQRSRCPHPRMGAKVVLPACHVSRRPVPPPQRGPRRQRGESRPRGADRRT